MLWTKLKNFDVINLKALNTFNAEQVEEGLLPIP